MTAKKQQRDDPAQSSAFIKAARELGTDDDPERFKAIVRKVAKAPPTPAEKGKPKKSGSPR